MMEILKNLAPEQVGTVLITLGALREVRKILNSVLDYKFKIKELTSKIKER